MNIDKYVDVELNKNLSISTFKLFVFFFFVLAELAGYLILTKLFRILLRARRAKLIIAYAEKKKLCHFVCLSVCLSVCMYVTLHSSGVS